jgi:protein phosphatase
MTTAQPPTSRYLWAAERQATWILADRLVEDRYHVISPQLWLDTKPQEPPEVLLPLPSQALAYAHLYPYKLHLPQLHGFCTLKRSGESIEIPLLENIPIDREGNLLPSLVEAWSKASPGRHGGVIELGSHGQSPRRWLAAAAVRTDSRSIECDR